MHDLMTKMQEKRACRIGISVLSVLCLMAMNRPFIKKNPLYI